MRLHIWDDDNPPTVHMDADDQYVKLLDLPHWVGYEVGDQVQYVTELGTEVYLVVAVDSAHEEFDGQTDANFVYLEQVR
jgi:hypothetical protein